MKLRFLAVSVALCALMSATAPAQATVLIKAVEAKATSIVSTYSSVLDKLRSGSSGWDHDDDRDDDKSHGGGVGSCRWDGKHGWNEYRECVCRHAPSNPACRPSRC